ncbi:HET-domain-containing protein [Apiospora aurea]|uniref:HET-domain-containing protein n=1 Tax=Apiospora aurea TaxID=335848 RepID=A0ABR1PYN9_9PEZI
MVNAAPVNTRGWVLQERLMAPRVLHFCKDQIAWECNKCDLYESQARGVPNFQLKYDKIVTEERIKSLEIEDGKSLRSQRLQGAPDPDKDMEHLNFFEIWTRIAEMYSRTAVTKPEDKLIALSGIAGMMADKMGESKNGSTPVYIAGLWKTHLASQLLWRVEPVFHRHDRSFTNLARRATVYRAPSFSWTAVDAHEGNGIIYGEVTDKDLLIRVDEHPIHIQLYDEKNPFGRVEKGVHVCVRGNPQRIEVRKKMDGGFFNGRFEWKFKGLANDLRPEDQKDLEGEEHTNVYLDCPASDEDSLGIFEKCDTYYLPVAMGPRTANYESKYFLGLLLQEAEEQAEGPLGREAKTFRRMGLSKLSPWGDKLAHRHIKKSFAIETGTPCDQWELDSGSQEFYLV